MAAPHRVSFAEDVAEVAAQGQGFRAGPA